MDKITSDYFLEFSHKEAKKALDYFIKSKKFSYEVQYSNETIYRWIIKYTYEVLNVLKKEHSEKTFLDFGCGIGAMEYFNELFFDCNIDSCDWINRDQIYDVMSLKKPKYNCSDWLDENFKIYDCDKKYDVILIMRSTLLHQNPDDTSLPNSFENFIKLLKKLLPYVKPSGQIILLQAPYNFVNETLKFLNKNNTKFIKSVIPGNGEVFSLKPSSIETFIF